MTDQSLSSDRLIVSAKELAFRRGRKAFNMGYPCPPRPTAATDWAQPSAREWAGWMTAMRCASVARREILSTYKGSA